MGEKGVPYMPRMFPKGKWNVLAVLPKSDPYMAPEFISTDAHQLVDEWNVRAKRDGELRYDVPSGRKVEDWGYGLHNSTSSTTLGCGRIMESGDREWLTSLIKRELGKGEMVTLEVV